MAGVSTKRCPGCDEVALVSDRGRVRVVGETRFYDTMPNGDTRFKCGGCGTVVVWERQTAKVR